MQKTVYLPTLMLLALSITLPIQAASRKRTRAAVAAEAAAAPAIAGTSLLGELSDFFVDPEDILGSIEEALALYTNALNLPAAAAEITDIMAERIRTKIAEYLDPAYQHSIRHKDIVKRVLQANRLYGIACADARIATDIRDRLLELLKSEITLYQQPFSQALDAAHAIIYPNGNHASYTAVSKKLQSTKNVVLKWAIRMVWSLQNFVNNPYHRCEKDLDHIPMSFIFLPNYFEPYCHYINFQLRYLDRHPKRDETIQIIVDLATTAVDKGIAVLPRTLKFFNSTGYQIPRIISVNAIGLSLSYNRCTTSLACIVLPNAKNITAFETQLETLSGFYPSAALQKLEVGWSNLSDETVAAFQRRRPPTLAAFGYRRSPY